MQHSSEQDTLLFSLSDLWRICIQRRLLIALGALAMTLFGCYWTLTKPVLYRAEATFREREKGGGSLSASFTDLMGLGGGSKQSGEAISLMHSRKLLEPLIAQKGLQASLVDQSISSGRWHRASQHLQSQWAHLSRRKTPLFPPADTHLLCQEVHYEGEVPLGFEIRFTHEELYELYDENFALIGKGQLHTPYNGEGYRFTLKKAAASSLKGKRFSLALLPMHLIAQSVAARLNIEQNSEDACLLDLSYLDGDRLQCAKMLNAIMESYQTYLQEESQRKADIQLSYLKKRQEEGARELETRMRAHAASLSQEIDSYGFTDSEKEMTFLAHGQKELKEKLLRLQLEKRHLTAALEEDPIPTDRLALGGDLTKGSPLLSSLRGLRQQRDRLHVTLHHSPHSSQRGKKLSESLEEIHTLTEQIHNLEQVCRQLSSSSTLPSLTFLQGEDPLVEAWLQRPLFDSLAQASSEPLPLTPFQGEEKKALFAYLENLQKVFQVRKEMLTEQLAYHQGEGEFLEGMDLQGARSLFVSYHTKLQENAASLRQLTFCLEQVNQSDTELSTLSALLQDPISRDIIARGYELQKLLQEESARTGKEQERIRRALAMERRLLLGHLHQTLSLQKGQKALLEEKIYQLQLTTLQLLNGEITLQEAQLKECLIARKEQIQQEERVVEKSLTEIQKQMATLPGKWVSEKLIEQQINHNKRVVEEVTKLAESKSIAHNLEIIQSAPVDRAVPPILPQSPRLTLFLLMGSIMGTLMATALTLFLSLAKGLKSSPQTLELQGERVLGSLQRDLSPTLRRVSSHMEQTKEKRTLLIQGAGPYYQDALQNLLAKSGKKVIQVPLGGDFSPQGRGGLLQYLEGEIDYPKGEERAGGHAIPSGGESDFWPELLASSRFEELLLRLERQYDCILLTTSADPRSAEAEKYLALASTAIVTVGGERLDELSALRNRSLAFVFRPC